MTIEEALDRIVIPRANGSDGLVQVAAFIEETLRTNGADVVRQPFTATPYGFQLVFAASFLLAAAFAVAILRARDGLSLVLAGTLILLPFAEMELLWSPVSGLLPISEDNVIGTFRGQQGAPMLVLSAHYDTATQFGDHVAWSRWARPLAATMLLMAALPLVGMWQQRRDRALPRPLRWTAAVLALVTFGVTAWYFVLGPAVRTPSPGALDNGGGVAVLLRLSERLARRPAGSPTTVTLAFFAAEEERTLGSWHYAQALASERHGPGLAVINLETVGADEGLAYVEEEGFPLRRYRPSRSLIDLVDDMARDLWGAPLAARSLPQFAVTDGRSFLAHAIPAVTLLSSSGFPRRLHSHQDRRERLSLPALDRTVDFLEALVARVERDPKALARSDRVAS